VSNKERKDALKRAPTKLARKPGWRRADSVGINSVAATKAETYLTASLRVARVRAANLPELAASLVASSPGLARPAARWVAASPVLLQEFLRPWLAE
jgi:hypothetical protein